MLLSRSSGALARVASWLHLGDPLLALVGLISITFLTVFFRFSVILSQLKDANVSECTEDRYPGISAKRVA